MSSGFRLHREGREMRLRTVMDEAANARLAPIAWPVRFPPGSADSKTVILAIA